MLLKNYLYKNGRLAAIIDFSMHNIGNTEPDSWTISMKQNVWFQGGICLEIVNLFYFWLDMFTDCLYE